MRNIFTLLWPASPKDPKTKQETKNTTQPQPDPEKPSDQSKEKQAAINPPARRWVE